MFENFPDLLSPKDLQEVLGLSKASIYKLLAQNDIPSIKIGKSYRTPKTMLIKYVESNLS